MRRKHKHHSHQKSKQDIYDDPYDNYNDGLDDESDGLSDLAWDFYSTDWEDPAGPKRSVSAKRQIERREDFNRMRSEIDGWDDFDQSNDWWE